MKIKSLCIPSMLIFALFGNQAYSNGIKTDIDDAIQQLLATADSNAAKSSNAATFEQTFADASAGNAQSQLELGDMYYDGTHGMNADFALALSWYEKSATQGNSEAQFNAGYMYENGEGTKKNYSKAIHWYEKAAAQDNKLALKELGKMYHKGLGVKKDYKKAFAYTSKAAEKGHMVAQYNLGYMYYYGHGTKVNYKKAREWLTKSANQGYGNAAMIISMLYLEGKGVKQDFAEAKYWAGVACENDGHQVSCDTYRKFNELGF